MRRWLTPRKRSPSSPPSSAPSSAPSSPPSSPTARATSAVRERWRARERERARCRKILKRATPSVAAFYANPRMPAALHLNALPSLTREMRHLMQTLSPFDVGVEPCTSLDVLRARVKQYRPRVVLYSGHAVRHSLLLETETGFGAIATHQDVHEAVAHPSVRILVFLGCHTSEVLRRALHPWQAGIGFATRVEDGAARAFAQGLVSELGDQVRTRRFDALTLFAGGKRSMTERGYVVGDPDVDATLHGVPELLVA